MPWRETSASILAQVANTTEDIIQPETVSEALNVVKGSLMILALFLILGLIVVIVRSSEYLQWELREARRGTDVEHIPLRKSRRQWREIIKKLRSKGDNAYKLAVIEADKMVDTFLEHYGYKGDSMAEKLKQIMPEDLANISELWEAHKTRNKIVHDLDVNVSKHEATRAIKIFQDTLEELQVL